MSDSQHRINVAKWAAEAVLAMAELEPIDIVGIRSEDADGVTAYTPDWKPLKVAYRATTLADGTVVRLITAKKISGDEMLPLLRTSPLRMQHTVHETWGNSNGLFNPWLEWVEQTALHNAVFGY